MKTIAVETAQTSLVDLLRQIAHGEVFTITQNGEPKARLTTIGTDYRKQGLLVHHTEHPITSADVARAMNEEYGVFLLDVNLLIALAWDAHEHRARAHH